MKLIIDIGNTNTKIALFDGKEIAKKIIFPNLELKLIKKFIGRNIINSAIVSCVKEFNTDIINIVTYFNATIFNETTKIPIDNKYKTINTLGNDRIAGIIGAIYLFPRKDVLVFDAGTCLTIDFANKNKQYLGGRISPGIAMRYHSLHNFTAKLPLLKYNKKHMYLGNDTNSSIISGVQHGILAEVNDIILDYQSCNNETVIIFTGGDSLFFEKELKNSIFAEPNLVLIGLNEILDYND